jgi:hypothetical protein
MTSRHVDHFLIAQHVPHTIAREHTKKIVSTNRERLDLGDVRDDGERGHNKKGNVINKMMTSEKIGRLARLAHHHKQAHKKIVGIKRERFNLRMMSETNMMMSETRENEVIKKYIMP